MADTAIDTSAGEEFHDDIIYPATIPFLVIHLSAFAAIWTGVSLWAVALCLGLYVVRMIIVTGGYHRYFSHRSFKTSRAGQFVLAFLAQTSLQRGVIWWAAIHRHHHK
ncbi:MAG: acyl-CoA desaturase, partial [Gemmatimonadetes bacterium]|nr:acyl-CoA desaturase [Gemmatimonadota bacterium]